MKNKVGITIYVACCLSILCLAPISFNPSGGGGQEMFTVTSDYTTLTGDGGSVVYHPSTDDNARMVYIGSPAVASYPVKTTITFVNEINTMRVNAINSSLTLQGANTTGSVVLAAGNTCTALKISDDKWVVAGSSGVTTGPTPTASPTATP